VPDTANGGFLEYRYVVRGFVGGGDFFHNAPNKTVILYSSLRLRQSRNIVGMTRARRNLLLVGDSSTLCRHPFFVKLLAYVKGVGGYRTAVEMVKQI
jgi:hypothetical protein